MSMHPRPSVKLALRLLGAFLLLSLADLYLTWRLVNQNDGRMIESNPVAKYWLTTYGWGGMTAFKLGIVLVIGGLAGVIAWRRPHTGELLLVFGCGAQSAVVVYSVFLPLAIDEEARQAPPIIWDVSNSEPGPGPGPPRSYERGPLPMNGLFLLLTHKAVQEELKLSEAEVREVAELAGARGEFRRRSGNLTQQQWDTQAQELLAREKAVIADRAPWQLKRLQQIAWQQRGPFALGDAEVAEALELTADQKETIRTLTEQVRPGRPGAPRGGGRGFDGGRRAGEERDRVRKELAAVLDADQQARWTELLGEPFKVELLSRPGGPPGPGRDPRRPFR
jgi:hypothetical protein